MSERGPHFQVQRIADKVKYYGVHGCLSCTYLLPAFNYGFKNGWFSEFNYEIIPSKKKYKKYIRELLDNFLPEQPETIPAPVVVLETRSSKFLVRQEIVQTSADRLVQHLQVFSADALLSFLGNKLVLEELFQTILLEIGTNTIQQKDGSD